jgi:Spy/CpxP family protein refolding chaperone
MASKTKILVTVVILLLLTNIAMLLFFLNNKDHGKRDGRGGRDAAMRSFLQKEIGFSDQQLQQYDSLSKQHKDQIRPSFDEMRNNREQDMKTLGQSGFNDSIIDASASRSAAMQKEMIKKMLLHFREIRQLCTPDQKPKFDSLFYKTLGKRDDRKRKD